MKISEIEKVLNNAWNVRSMGKNNVPCIIGPAGIGKSQAVHQWARAMAKKIPGFEMLDRRCALLDPSDFQGLPFKDEVNQVTKFLPPSILPRDGAGVLFLDEINRAPTPVLNAVLQLLTERRVGDYLLPEKWIIVTANNPENSDAYDVNVMDLALKSRMLLYNVNFDHSTFLKYGVENGWSNSVTSFIATGEWIYKETPGEDGFYISPRNWEYLSDDELAGSKEDSSIHHETCIALLGKNVGMSYWNYCHKSKPIYYDEIFKEYSQKGRNPAKIMDLDSMKALKKYSDSLTAGAYRADLVGSTINSFTQNKKDGDIDENILVKVADILPADQAAALVQKVALLNSSPIILIEKLKTKYPDTFSRIRGTVKKDVVKTKTPVTPVDPGTTV
jgi:hypothetical protein